MSEKDDIFKAVLQELAASRQEFMAKIHGWPYFRCDCEYCKEWYAIKDGLDGVAQHFPQ